MPRKKGEKTDDLVLLEKRRWVGINARDSKTGIHAPEMRGVGGRIGGRIAGAKTRDQKLGIHAPEMHGVGGRKSRDEKVGIHAPGMAEVGGYAGGPIGGAKSRDQKLGFHSPDYAHRRADVGRQSGRKLRDEKLGIHAPGYDRVGPARQGGRIGGRKTADAQLGMYAPELKGYGLHVRWHVNRGIANEECAFCCDESLSPPQTDAAK